jgi:hypothetical protein
MRRKTTPSLHNVYASHTICKMMFYTNNLDLETQINVVKY